LQRLCKGLVNHQMKRSTENIIGITCVTIYLLVATLVAVAAWRDHQAERDAFSTPGTFNISVEPKTNEHKRKHRN
jgi:hypothetical protein